MTKQNLPLYSFVLFVALQVGVVQGASKDPSYWLSKMQVAAIEANYKGTFVFSRGAMSSSVRVVHRFKDGFEEERLTQLDGQQGEVIRRGNQVMCVLPDNRGVKVDHGSLSNPLNRAFSSFMPKQPHYALEYSGMDRVIRRPAVKVQVNAADAYRHSYHLWLDEQSGLLLKSSMVDSDGQELERFQFTQITFPNDIGDHLFEASVGAVEVLNSSARSKQPLAWMAESGWSLSWVPPGFTLREQSQQPGTNARVFSDGLAMFSVFLDETEAGKMTVGATRVGATVGYFHEIQNDAKTFGVTVMGEISPKAAMMIAESVTFSR